ncbi:MAG: diguanylate cyclase [Velocimicrobium sp.]
MANKKDKLWEKKIKFVLDGYKISTIFITAFIIFIVDYCKVPNPAIICLIGVAFATFIAGTLYGIISGLMSFMYCSYFFSINRSCIKYTDENMYKVIVIIIAIVTMVAMVGVLKRRVEIRTRELEEANKKLYDLSVLDGLTGLANRRHLEFMLNEEWENSIQNRSSLSLAMIDIDFFKRYNDTYGHQAGDECLKQVAEVILKQGNNSFHFVGRYGGEEFVIIMPETSIEEVEKAMEEMRVRIVNLQIPHIASDNIPFVTVSIGVVSMTPNAKDNITDFLKNLDSALYQAKNSGRNQVQSYEANTKDRE